MELETVLYRVEGNVGIVSLNRTKALNAMSKQIDQGLFSTPFGNVGMVTGEKDGRNSSVMPDLWAGILRIFQ